MRVQADGQHGAQERKAARPMSNHGKAEAIYWEGRERTEAARYPCQLQCRFEIVLCCAMRAGFPGTAGSNCDTHFAPAQQEPSCAWADVWPKTSLSYVLCVQAGFARSLAIIALLSGFCRHLTLWEHCRTTSGACSGIQDLCWAQS